MRRIQEHEHGCLKGALVSAYAIAQGRKLLAQAALGAHPSPK